MLFDSGAEEVHVRVSSPPVVSPCFYGIDMADEAELAAADRTVEEMRELIGATSLAYLSVEGMQWADAAPVLGGVPRLLHARVPDRDVPTEWGRGEAPLRERRRDLTRLGGTSTA